MIRYQQRTRTGELSTAMTILIGVVVAILVVTVVTFVMTNSGGILNSGLKDIGGLTDLAPNIGGGSGDSDQTGDQTSGGEACADQTTQEQCESLTVDRGGLKGGEGQKCVWQDDTCKEFVY